MRRTAVVMLAVMLVSAWREADAQSQVQPGLTPQGPARLQTTMPPGALTQPRQLPKVGPIGLPSLQFIDPGYAEAQPDGSRTLTFAACVEDSHGTQGKVVSMSYELKLKGATSHGDMAPFLPSSKPLTYKNSGNTKAIGPIEGCRQARISFPPCAVDPGVYDVTVTADLGDGMGGLQGGAKPVFGPNTSTVSLETLSGFETATPRQVSGTAATQCKGRPKEVQLFTDGGADIVTAPVGADGRFATSIAFRHAGPARLHALVVGDEAVGGADAFTDLKVAPVQANAEIAALPPTARVGTAEPVVAVLRNRATKQVLGGIPVTFKLGDAQDCGAETRPDGEVHCSLALSANPAAVGATQKLNVSSSDANIVDVTGPSKVLLISTEGLIVHKVSATLLQVALAAAQPYGILINAYNPDWTGTGAHLDNASRLYPTSDPSKSEPFDVPSLHVTDNIVFYPDNVLIRLKPFRFVSPSRVTTEFYITGANGRGPRIKGFCFTRVVCGVIGYDDSMPDIDNISVKNGAFAMTFAVADGRIKPSLAAIHAELDFTCGGIASVACGFIREKVNTKLNQALDGQGKMDAMLQRVGGNMDAAVAPWLPQWSIKTLTGLSWNDGGDLIVTGTPLAP